MYEVIRSYRQIESQLVAPTPTATTPVVAVTWDPTGDAIVDGFSGTFTLSNGDLDLNRTASGWHSATVTAAKSSGKYYFEMKMITGTDYFGFGMIETGWTTLAGLLVGQMFGSANSFGMDARGDAFSLETAAFTRLGAYPTMLNGDVFGCAIDLTLGRIWLAQNNDYTAFLASSNPATNTNPSLTYTPPLTLYPACSLYAGDPTVVSRLAASSGHAYSPPSGFSVWGG